MPAPRHSRLLRQDYFQLRRSALFTFNQRDSLCHPMGRQPAPIGRWIRQRGRQRHTLHCRGQRLKPCHGEGQQVPALAIGEGMHLIHHDPLEARKQRRALRIGQQQ